MNSKESLFEFFAQIGPIASATPQLADQLLLLLSQSAHKPLPAIVTDVEVARFIAALLLHPATRSISKHELAFLLNTSPNDLPDPPASWIPENLFVALINRNKQLSLSNIMLAFDKINFEVRDYQGVAFVSAAFSLLSKTAPFPLSVLLGNWSNVKAQFSLIMTCVRFMPDVLIANPDIKNVIFLPEVIASKLGPANLARSPWNIPEVVKTLVRLSKTPEIAADVHSLIESSCLQNPELLLLGLAQVPLEDLQHNLPDIVLKLTQVFITGHPNASLVVPKLWDVAPNILIAGLVRVYSADVYSLSRVLDIAQELKALPQILESKPYFFAMDLAALASRRDFLNLEKWLQDRIRVSGVEFVRSALQFLHEKILAAFARSDKAQTIKPSVPLSAEVISTICRVLSAHQNIMAPEEIDLLSKLSSTGMQLLTRGGVIGAGPETLVDPAAAFGKDVEDEANGFFEKMYKGEVAVPLIVSSLKKLQVSQNPREQALFKCVIQNIFDEYKYYSGYPEKELMLTAQLFGSIVQFDIVTGNHLGVALRGVLEALKQTIESTMFKFGLQALLQFQSRLPEWPQYSALLLQIDHLKQSSPEIYSMLEKVLKQDGAGATKEQPLSSSSSPPVFTSIDLDNLPMDGQETAPEKTRDRILFILNNISSENVEAKISEMKDALKDSYLAWFAKYFVEKRVSIEPNYHTLYIQLLEGIEGGAVLQSHILRESLTLIKSLINSEKTVTSSADRTLLKNLASWLGAITLAKNKPIKYKNVAFKELLLEGYDSNRLIVSIPFVCKVVEQCSKSRIFKSPNPWLMGIMKLLAELYHFAELKLNLKFEIEVLCKALSLDIKEISPTTMLRDRPTKNQMEAQKGTQEGFAGNIEALISNLASFITFNPSVPMISGNPAMRRLVIFAINKAIEEILPPVTERSVTIAGIATKELVSKDFALEADENKMRKSAHMMAQSLAGSLASVTSREPLRISIIQNLRSALLQNGFSEQNLPEQAIYIVVSENLEMVCSVIEKTASEKAIEEIDNLLRAAFQARNKHKEQRSNQPYVDMAVYANSRYPASLPEPLRLRPGGLVPQQLKVYEDFLRLPRPDNMDRTKQAGFPGEKTAIGPNVSEDPDTMPLPLNKVLEKFNTLAIDLDMAIKEYAADEAQPILQQQSIQTIIKQMRVITVRAVNREEAAFNLAQRLLRLLLSVESDKEREVYAFAFEKLLVLSTKTVKEVNSWFIFSNDERKQNAAVYKLLMQSGILSVQEVDCQLARLLDTGTEKTIKFVVEVIDACSAGQNLSFSIADFFVTSQKLKKLIPSKFNTSAALSVLEKVSKSGEIRLTRGEPEAMKEQLKKVFEDWIKVFSHPLSNAKMQRDHVVQMLQNPILLSDDTISLFFRICAEQAFENCLTSLSSPAVLPAQVFAYPDGLARLIVLLLKFTPSNSTGSMSKVNMFTKILSISLLVLVNVHQQLKMSFNQKPFFRFFSSLLTELDNEEDALKPFSFQIMSAVCNTFHTAQPSLLPAFTFSWLQLISHRHFMPKMLSFDNHRGWPFFHRLLVDLFTFLRPLLTKPEFTDSVRYLYRGTLRVLLVLLHDFPEFLCSYHFSFMDAIPLSCIQIRNLILSAFPGGMRLPDPFTPNLKVDLLPEIHQNPQIHSDYTYSLITTNIKSDLDAYLGGKAPSNFISDLKSRLMVDAEMAEATDSAYNIPAINALVFYAGVHCLSQLQSKQGSMNGPLQVAGTIAVDLLMRLLTELDSEGRYLVLSAVANHLRFPNSHTHFFSCIIFQLFLKSQEEVIKEQITRVLLERLIVNRPHPYGLLITFIELIRNPDYKFWEHTSFIRCAPEIERLFSSVAKSINNSFIAS